LFIIVLMLICTHISHNQHALHDLNNQHALHDLTERLVGGVAIHVVDLLNHPRQELEYQLTHSRNAVVDAALRQRQTTLWLRARVVFPAASHPRRGIAFAAALSRTRLRLSVGCNNLAPPSSSSSSSSSSSMASSSSSLGGGGGGGDVAAARFVAVFARSDGAATPAGSGVAGGFDTLVCRTETTSTSSSASPSFDASLLVDVAR
jgi:hypothetical protein